MLPKPLVPLLLLACGSLSDPIIIKSGIARDHAQHHGGDLYDLSSRRGISNFEADDGFNKGNEREHVGAQDYGKYGQEIADSKQFVSGKDFANDNFRKEVGSGIEDFDKKAGHKKGHHKSGFHNTYHKDEKGSQSSYYDDSNDESGEYLKNNRQGAFGDSGSSKNRGHFLDGSKYAKDDAKYGGYNNEGLYEKDFGNRRNYNQKKYFDDMANQGKSNAGNQYGEAGRYVEEEYHKPYYYQERPFYPAQGYQQSGFLPQRQTITIYEDPRVYEREAGYSGYNNYPEYDRYDSSRLDVRRPIPLQHGYSNERPVYENDYYY